MPCEREKDVAEALEGFWFNEAIAAHIKSCDNCAAVVRGFNVGLGLAAKGAMAGLRWLLGPTTKSPVGKG